MKQSLENKTGNNCRKVLLAAVVAASLASSGCVYIEREIYGEYYGLGMSANGRNYCQNKKCPGHACWGDRCRRE